MTAAERIIETLKQIADIEYPDRNNPGWKDGYIGCLEKELSLYVGASKNLDKILMGERGVA